MKENVGYCVICETDTIFIEHDDWLRDHYLCGKCKSIPRQRAIINALNYFVPQWRNMTIHESSPCGAASDFIMKICHNYSFSFFFPNQKIGVTYNGIRCEDLERLTFKNERFDIFITQDVLEHVMKPKLAFRQIKRVLKYGGYHIFTIPWYPDNIKSKQRAIIKNGKLQHLDKPLYHGNPIDSSGSLVVYEYGADLVDQIYRSTKMSTIVYLCRDRTLGLDGKFLEVFISRKIN